MWWQGNWAQLHGLVQDGVGFSRARVNAKLGRGGAAGYQPVPSHRETEAESGQSDAKRSGSKSKKSTKETSKRSKDGTSPKQSTRVNGSNRNKRNEVPAHSDPVVAEETAEEERARLLHEERTAGVHSSQQAIKVVGLNG